MQRRSFLLKGSAALAVAGVTLAGCTTTTSQPESAAANESRRRSIDAAVDGTISRLYETVPGSRELVGKSRGVLVFPQVIQAGLIVGGERGDGALRVGGHTEGYFSTTSASVGAQIGVQSKSLIYLFMTQEALDRFRKSDGWAVGGDASVALVKVGANGAIDTNTATSPVEVFVLTNAGLMGNLSLSGTKVTRLKI